MIECSLWEILTYTFAVLIILVESFNLSRTVKETTYNNGHTPLILSFHMVFQQTVYYAKMLVSPQMQNVHTCSVQSFNSYSQDRSFRVAICKSWLSSEDEDDLQGTPRVCPCLVLSLPLGHVIRRYVAFHSYADDTHLYLSFNPNDRSQSQIRISSLNHCILDLKS